MFGRKLGVGLGVLATLLVGGCGGDGGSGGGTATTSTSAPAPTGTVQVDQTLARTVSSFVASFRFTFFDASGAAVYGPTQTARVATIRLPGVPVAATTFLIEYLSSSGATIGRFESAIAITDGGTTLVEDPAWTDVAPTGVTFGLPSTWGVGDGPIDLVVRDFDGDSDFDFATANETSSDVTLRLGDGQGAFADPVSVAAGTNPLGINAGFLDGDGNLDLVVGNGSSNDVSVLLGNGDGTFQPQVPFAADGGVAHPAVADLDGNGTLDLALPLFLAQKVQVLLNDGSGQFTALTAVSTDPCNRQRNAVTEDFDNDGDEDVAASADIAPGRYSTLGNTGTGALLPATVTFVGDFGPVFWVEAADLDGDGNVDLAVGADQATLFAKGNGDGTFASAVQVADSSDQIAVADVNGDGRPDLVGQSGTTIRILLGNGDGTFEASTITAPVLTSGVRVADFDGDGTPDILAFARGTDQALLFLQD